MKHIWLSTSTDLHADAQRDLSDLGMHVNVINNCQALDSATKVGGLSKDFQEGVLFLTYSTLTSAAKGKQSRLAQVLEWVGGAAFEGCLVFDECHKCDPDSSQSNTCFPQAAPWLHGVYRLGGGWCSSPDVALQDGYEGRGRLVSEVCRAKNFTPGKEAQSTKVAAAVLDLQRALPMALSLIHI